MLALASAAVALAAWFGPMGTSTFRHREIVDTGVYYGYADAAAHGRLPYRDVTVEYPPLAFAAMLPPRLGNPDPASYSDAFRRLMGWCLALAAAATALAAAAAGARPWRVAAAGLLVALGPLLAGSVSLTRFDLWPVLLVALALWLAAARRDTWAAALLGLGTAAKLWPILALPSFLLLAARRGGAPAVARALGAFTLAAAVPFAVALALSPSGLWHAITVQTGRPLQIESLGGAGLIALAQRGIGGPYTVVWSHGSQNLPGSGPDLVASLSTVALLAALALVWLAAWRGVRRAPDDGSAYARTAGTALAAVAAAIALGKVLSPQFVLWLLPFPLLVGRRPTWPVLLTLFALVATQIEFPRRYWDYVALDHGVLTLLVLARDLAILALAVVAALPAWRNATASA